MQGFLGCRNKNAAFDIFNGGAFICISLYDCMIILFLPDCLPLYSSSSARFIACS